MNDIISRISEFPMTVGDVVNRIVGIPVANTRVLYHYTNRAGLTGIVSDGGLRAKHRGKMNDGGEFAYPRSVIDEVFAEIATHTALAPLTERLLLECRTNLDRNVSDPPESNRAYCACFSLSRDQESQWRAYAEDGNGFALGFDYFEICRIQRKRMEAGEPWLWLGSVIYDRDDQVALITGVVAAAISDMQRFADECSKKTEDLTAFYRRVLLEVVTMLIACVDFIKHPEWRNEREMRVMADSNDGTFNAQNIQYSAHDGFSFLLYDLRDAATARLPLSEIIVGPNAVFRDEIRFIEALLDETLYFNDRPRVVMSSVTPWA